MNGREPRRVAQGGFSTFKLLVFFGIVGALMTIGFKYVPAYYEFVLLRDLADRVVRDYTDLPKKEVERRVSYEFNRSQLNHLHPDTFIVEKTRNGYRVIVDYRIPLPFKVGEREEIIFDYETES